MTEQTLPDAGAADAAPTAASVAITGAATVTDIEDAGDDGGVDDGAGNGAGPGDRARLRPVLFRLHFFGGFFAGPIVLWLAVTGVLYTWNPQIESWIFGDEWAAIEDGGEVRSLAAQLDAVAAAYPDHELVEVTPSDGARETTAVLVQPAGAVAEGFGPAPGAFTAYVDPVSAEVTGRVAESSRPDEWLRNLHSSARLGERVGTLTEMAASWVAVSLLTGLYLWWPRTRRAWRRAVAPRLQGLVRGGRRPWRNLHATLGALTFVVLGVVVVSGLTWTEYAGRWVDVGKDAIGSEGPTLQTELATSSSSSSSSGDEHHGGGSAASGESSADADAIDRVVAGALDAGLRQPFTVTPAGEPGQAWTVGEIDDRWPVERTTAAVDPASGDVVDEVRFAQDPLVDKLTTWGIGFHEGTLFGLFNQVLLTLLAVALMAMLASGYVMWWKRRPAGAFGPPPKFGSVLRTVPVPLLLGFAVLMVLLPTLAVSFLLFLVGERIVWLVRRRRRPAEVA